MDFLPRTWRNARSFTVVLVVLAALAVALAGCGQTRAPGGRFAAVQPLLERALTPAGVVELAAATDFPLCELDVRLDAGGLSGRARYTVVNRAPQALTELAFHVFANGKAFNGGAMVLEHASVDGAPVTGWRMVDEDTGLYLPLPRPLAAGARTEILLDYHVTISETGGFHGLLSHQEGVWCLYSWYPELAVYRAGAWEMHPLSDKGDVTQNDSLHMVARVTLPTGVQAISSGTIVATTPAPDGGSCVTIASPFTRNLALVVGPGYASSERQAGATTVRSWWRNDDQAGADRALATAADALTLFSERFGPYPYRELDVVEVPLGQDVGGMESTGLVLMDRRPYEALRSIASTVGCESLPVLILTVSTAHEVAHQWWYNLVGSDSFTAPWLDESLTNWSGNYCLEQTMGQVAGSGAFNLCLMGGSQGGASTQHLDLDVNGYDPMQYGTVVYGRGALMYQALRRRVGDERFFAFLRSYLAHNRYAYVDRAEWERCLRMAVGDAVTDEWIRVWLHGEKLTLNDLARAAVLIPAKPAAPAK